MNITVCNAVTPCSLLDIYCCGKTVKPVFRQRKRPHLNIEATHSFQQMVPSTKPHGSFHGHNHWNVKFRGDCYGELIAREILCICPFQKRQRHGLHTKEAAQTYTYPNINRRNGFYMSRRWMPLIHNLKATTQQEFSNSVIELTSRGKQINK